MYVLSGQQPHVATGMSVDHLSNPQHVNGLYPLFDSTLLSRSRVVSPVIDVIDWKTLQYYPSKDLQRGVLDWKLDFHWEPLPERERKALRSPISPVR